MKYNFYDTCSLLLKANHLWDDEAKLVISSITLQELEHIKTASNKDAETKYSARKVVSELDKHLGEYKVVVYYSGLDCIIDNLSLEVNNDSKIIACVDYFYQHIGADDKLTFITNDICCKHLARLALKDYDINIVSYEETKYDYNGYKEVYLTNDELIDFYSHPEENQFELLTNEYLLIYDKETDDCVDKVCWTGEKIRSVSFYTFDSNWFGRIKPMKDDVYQALVADSFKNNRITMVRGKAGSGKTTLALAYLMSELEKHKIDKIIVFCNTVATKNAAKLGFYPGSKDEKLLDSQIGNMLASKLGGSFAVQQMIDNDRLVLLPLADVRGFDTNGQRAGVYITEAQNMDIEMMRLALQRIGEDSVCIIDGDFNAQVDLIEYSGNSNGMKRASEVFRGSKIYGEVNLKIIHRSEIAAIADKM